MELEVHPTQNIYIYIYMYVYIMGFPGGSVGKESACKCRRPPAVQTWLPSLGQEDPLEKEVVTHTSILTSKIPWTEKPDGLQSMGLQSRTWLSD